MAAAAVSLSVGTNLFKKRSLLLTQSPTPQLLERNQPLSIATSQPCFGSLQERFTIHRLYRGDCVIARAEDKARESPPPPPSSSSSIQQKAQTNPSKIFQVFSLRDDGLFQVLHIYISVLYCYNIYLFQYIYRDFLITEGLRY